MLESGAFVLLPPLFYQKLYFDWNEISVLLESYIHASSVACWLVIYPIVILLPSITVGLANASNLFFLPKCSGPVQREKERQKKGHCLVLPAHPFLLCTVRILPVNSCFFHFIPEIRKCEATSESRYNLHAAMNVAWLFSIRVGYQQVTTLSMANTRRCRKL